MPPISIASPSRAGTSIPCSFSPPQATRPSGAASASAQATIGRRRSIERGILSGLTARGTGGVHAGRGAEARRLVGLEARDRHPLELPLRGLLEDHAQALERLGGLAPHPAVGADLLEAIHPRGRLAQRGQLDAGDVVALDREVVDRHGAVAAAPADRDLLDDPARAVDLADLKLGVLLPERQVQLEARGGTKADRVDARKPVVAHEVVLVRGPRGEVADEVEDLLAGRGD